MTIGWILLFLVAAVSSVAVASVYAWSRNRAAEQFAALASMREFSIVAQRFARSIETGGVKREPINLPPAAQALVYHIDDRRFAHLAGIRATFGWERLRIDLGQDLSEEDALVEAVYWLAWGEDPHVGHVTQYAGLYPAFFMALSYHAGKYGRAIRDVINLRGAPGNQRQLSAMLERR